MKSKSSEGGNGVQPCTGKVYLIKWLMSVIYLLSLQQLKLNTTTCNWELK